MEKCASNAVYTLIIALSVTGVVFYHDPFSLASPCGILNGDVNITGNLCEQSLCLVVEKMTLVGTNYVDAGVYSVSLHSAKTNITRAFTVSDSRAAELINATSIWIYQRYYNSSVSGEVYITTVEYVCSIYKTHGEMSHEYSGMILAGLVGIIMFWAYNGFVVLMMKMMKAINAYLSSDAVRAQVKALKAKHE
jgi:hypothetical protein